MTVRKTGGGRRLLLTQITGYGVGGVERYCSNMLENMDLSGYDVTYYTPQRIWNQEEADRLRSLGIDMRAGNMSEPAMSASVGEKLKFHFTVVAQLRALCREKSFDIIHVNTGSIIFQAYIMFFARLFGIKRRLSHSHSADFTQHGGRLRTVITHNATDLLTCSDVAAKCLFGEKAAPGAIVMKNGIDLKKFAFDGAAREAYRAKLGIKESEFVIGHVGNFGPAKNHKFLVEAFRIAADRDPALKLLLLGGGLEREVRAQVQSLGLEDRVILAGQQKDVENYYCAMDAYAMPSVCEGLGFAGIEAQASGLYCLFSDRMPPEVKVTEHAEFLPIEDAGLWAERILEARGKTLRREDAWTAVRDAGYDVRECAAALRRLYDGA